MDSEHNDCLPRVIITRPRMDAMKMGKDVQAFGGYPLIAPMLEIERLPWLIEPRPRNVQLVILTSRHAVYALEQLALTKDIPVITVGPATLEAVRQWSPDCHVMDAGGNVEQLVSLVQAGFIPGRGELLYLRGEHVRQEIAGGFREAGYPIREFVVYRANAVKRLPDNVRILQRQDIPVIVPLFSARTAQILVERLSGEWKNNHFQHWDYLCISQSVASCCREKGLRHISVAESVDYPTMLHLVEQQVRSYTA